MVVKVEEDRGVDMPTEDIEQTLEKEEMKQLDIIIAVAVYYIIVSFKLTSSTYVITLTNSNFLTE